MNLWNFWLSNLLSNSGKMANNQGPENPNPGASQIKGPIVEQLKIMTHDLSSQGAFNYIQPFDRSDLNEGSHS